MGFTFKRNTLLEPHEDWIYYFYLALRHKLNGSSIRTHSVFTNEKTPSLFVYLNNGRYKWKDHSSGKGGDAIDLAKAIFENSLGEAVDFKNTIELINGDYDNWRKKHKDYLAESYDRTYYGHELTFRYKTRAFNKSDYDYWNQFGISPDLLKDYGVICLDNYTLGKKISSSDHGSGTTVWGNEQHYGHSYGFMEPKSGFDLYDHDGNLNTKYCDLVKIYNPYSYCKHVTLKNVMLGSHQLNWRKNKTVIIMASMKDMLTLKGLNLDVDAVSPIGERVILTQSDISYLKAGYVNVLTLFDNDKTGIKSMAIYEKLYGIKFIYLPFYKDISEFREKTDKKTVKEEVTIRINKKIFKPILKDEKTPSNSTEWKKEISRWQDSEKF